MFHEFKLDINWRNPDTLKSDDIEDIDDFDNIVQNTYILTNDCHRWWYY